MTKPGDIPQGVWDRAFNEMDCHSPAAMMEDDDLQQSVHTAIARAILSAVEEEREACALEALRWQDGIDAAEHIRRRNRKGA